jgi:hypothetical protein
MNEKYESALTRKQWLKTYLEDQGLLIGKNVRKETSVKKVGGRVNVQVFEEERY